MKPISSAMMLTRGWQRWLLACAYAALIVTLSSIPAKSMPSGALWDYDKAIHALEYAWLGFLVAWALHAGTGPLRHWRWLFSFVATSAFGFADELYQTTIPGRAADLADAAADSLGALLGVVVASVIVRLSAMRQTLAPDKDPRLSSNAAPLGPAVDAVDGD